MRFQLLAALVCAATATSAYAAKTTTVMTGSQSKNVIAPNATSVAAVSSSAVVVPSSASMVMPNSGSSLTTSMKSVTGPKIKLKPSYVAENAAPSREFNTGTYEGFFSQQHIGLAYDLGNDRKIQYRQYFYYNMTDAVKTDEWSIGEHVVQYTDATALKIADADMLFYARLYLPGAEYAREVGKYELRLVQSVSQALSSRVTAEYALGTRLFSYSSNSDGQRGLRMLPSAQLSYKINDNISPFAAAFTDHNWYHTGSGIAVLGSSAGNVSNPDNYKQTFNTDIGAEVTINKNISFVMYVETTNPITPDKEDTKYRPFQDENNTYALDLTVKM